MTDEQHKLQGYALIIADTFSQVDRLLEQVKRQEDMILSLEKENRRMIYEHEDSLLERDIPLPYKWEKTLVGIYMKCPKCDMSIANWQGYCGACGQRIKVGNPQPEMEVLDND